MKDLKYISVGLLLFLGAANGKSLPRTTLPDPFAEPCPDTPITLTQVSGNLYRHTIGSPGFYSGLVLITKEGALIVDPARTCTARRLRDEIQERFQVPPCVPTNISSI